MPTCIKLCGSNKCYWRGCPHGPNMHWADIEASAPPSKLMRGLEDAIAFARGDISRARTTTKETPAE